MEIFIDVPTSPSSMPEPRPTVESLSPMDQSANLRPDDDTVFKQEERDHATLAGSISEEINSHTVDPNKIVMLGESAMLPAAMIISDLGPDDSEFSEAPTERQLRLMHEVATTLARASESIISLIEPDDGSTPKTT